MKFFEFVPQFMRINVPEIPQKVQQKLGVDLESLNKSAGTLSVIYPKASKSNQQNMHDLNALALTGLLTLHAQTSGEKELAPPFLPIVKTC